MDIQQPVCTPAAQDQDAGVNFESRTTGKQKHKYSKRVPPAADRGPEADTTVPPIPSHPRAATSTVEHNTLKKPA